jgi:hypothetical protein
LVRPLLFALWLCFADLAAQTRSEPNFHESCALARAATPDRVDAAERLVRTAGLRNPALALRESAEYLSLPGGPRLFEAFVHAAPDEAMAMAAGASKSAQAMYELLSSSRAPEIAVLVRLAGEQTIDQPRRRRMAILAGRIARGEITFASSLKLAGDTQQFFAAVVDMRAGTSGADAAPLDRALENESLVLCLGARESLARTIASDLARFRTRDLYAMLAMGRAEATPEVFAAVFDRLLLPKWKAEQPRARSLLALLDQSQNWGLRDFAAGALAARRLDALLSVAGPELVHRVTGGIDQTADPLKEGMRLAEIVDATTSAALLEQMRAIVTAEFARCRGAGDSGCSTIYGLLAAKLSLGGIGDRYAPYLRSSESLDAALLCGERDQCVERHFFWDDEDGIRSFESFLKGYRGDPAWKIEEHGTWVQLRGRGPTGRRIEIFANVPIDSHLPANRAREEEAQRRQGAIAEALRERGLVASILVHRGHSFWVGRTMSYVGSDARLVVLGSCGGATEVHAVIEASHEAQVIATRGVGETGINDQILKTMNDRLLEGGGVIEWKSFWQDLSGRARGGLFRDYVAPHQDTSMVFLRAYYRFLDAASAARNQP